MREDYQKLGMCKYQLITELVGIPTKDKVGD